MFRHPKYYKELRKRNKEEARAQLKVPSSDLDHLNKIYEVCRLTPSKRHWMPTREAWIKDHMQDKPDNLVIRFSAPMVNQRAPDSWPHSSSVIDKAQPWFGATSVMCPAPKQNNECKDCRQCWNPEIKNVSYCKH